MDNQNNNIIIIESCKNCGRILKDEWQFCPFCNATVETVSCPYCREDIKRTWEFCPYCKRKLIGEPQTPSGFENANDWLRTILKD